MYATAMNGQSLQWSKKCKISSFHFGVAATVMTGDFLTYNLNQN